MNKIISQVGLLVFFVGVIFFAQRGLPVEQVLLRSFMVFVFVTIMLAIIAILILRSIKRVKKNENLAQNITGK